MKKLSKRKKKRIFTTAAVLILMAVSLVFTSFMGIIELPFEISAWKDVFKLVNIETITDVPDSDFSVTFLDVGQGDCSLIKSGGQTMLIDGGEPENADKILNFLKENSITKLDYVVATHPHSDHIGGLDVVISEIDVKQVLMPKVKKSIAPTTKTYQDLLAAIQDQNITAAISEPGQTYAFGKGLLTVLGPVQEYDDLNDSSLVARFDYGSFSFLFTGDMEAGAEQDLLDSGADVSANVLKLGHHGSATSSSEDFLQAVDPGYCVASCGEDNEYGHPHKETLQRVEQAGASLYRTDYQGDIVFMLQNEELVVSAQKG